MITWGQLVNFLPLGLVLIAIGVAKERLAALAKRQDALETEQKRSAESQGRRTGNLESYVGLTADGIPVERMGDFSGRVRGSNDR